jgi:hypothetical protein
VLSGNDALTERCAHCSDPIDRERGARRARVAVADVSDHDRAVARRCAFGVEDERVPAERRHRDAADDGNSNRAYRERRPAGFTEKIR